jgi:hypothetical protein
MSERCPYCGASGRRREPTRLNECDMACTACPESWYAGDRFHLALTREEEWDDNDRWTGGYEWVLWRVADGPTESGFVDIAAYATRLDAMDAAGDLAIKLGIPLVAANRRLF